MTLVAKVQTAVCSKQSVAKFCSFDRDSITAPAGPLLFQGARFMFIIKGSGSIKIQNKNYSLSPNTLISIMPWEIVEFTEVQQQLHCLIVRYRFDVVNDVMRTNFNINNAPVKVKDLITNNPVIRCIGKDAHRISSIFKDLEEENGLESALEISNSTVKPMSTILIISKLIELFALYVRFVENNCDCVPIEESDHDYSDIILFIATHLSEKITLKRLSYIFSLPENTISTYIREITGLSLNDLLNEMRVIKTVDFLLYTNLTLEDISSFLGFVDSSHLSKVFSARMGSKINRYRKTYGIVNDICKIRHSKKGYALVNYIYENYAKPIDAKMVADHFGITVNEMNQILLYQVEKNFSVFLNTIRINQACLLLSSTDDSILKIAMDVGYNTVKTFNRQFLRIKGITPNSLRKNTSLVT